MYFPKNLPFWSILHAMKAHPIGGGAVRESASWGGRAALWPGVASKTRTRTILAALVLSGLAALPAVATGEIAKHERAKCTVCHAKQGGGLLTNKGKYYEYKRCFEGYDEVLAKFKKCTLCHLGEPGSMELNRTGMELKNRDVTMDHISASGRPQPAPAETKTDPLPDPRAPR